MSRPGAAWGGVGVPKGSAPLLAHPGIPEATRSGAISDGIELIKARLTLMVLITTSAGYGMASGSAVDGWRLLLLLLGTGLVASSAQAMNQVMEIDVDGLMTRTRNRPLPAGRMTVSQGIGIGIVSGVAGLAVLGFFVGALPAALAALTHGIYLVAYTPMKRRSAWCVWVGAIPGALPPVIGWSAARDLFAVEAAVLFGILFLWQLPHFIAIAWMCREDYERAGLAMLRGNDSSGRIAAGESFLFAVALAALGAGATFLLSLPAWYLVASVAVSGWFAWKAMGFLESPTVARARALFFASILYLPASLVLLLCASA